MSIEPAAGTAPWIRIADAAGHLGETVEVRGWLTHRRSSGKVQFLVVRDGSGTLQCVAGARDLPASEWEAAAGLGQESSLVVRGSLRADARSPGGVEMGLQALRVVSAAEGFPISPKEHGIDFLMDHRHLWLRSARQQAILRIRAEIVGAFRDFMDGEAFVLVDAPIFTPSACEGTTTLFETSYFGEQAFLTQSGQLYAEAAAMALGRVYCFGPAFRAEKSKTRRHLIEFWMMEPEWAFATLDDIVALEERLLEYTVGRVLDRRAEDLRAVERDVAKLERVRAPFPRIRYDAAVERLHAAGVAFEWGNDFGGTDETVLSEQFDRPLFVTHYPAAVKPFYMEPDPADSRVCLSCDCLAPEGYGEIIGGGQRMESLDLLARRIDEHGLPREAFQWYLDLRRYGSVPHAGFGIGVERTLAWIAGLDHVRETIAFPRMLYRLRP
ncbi:MAG: asparagine--tRNA ligase [Candidatus Eisenbacteria bacterium RBG_16_71_46]|nr:MAG: asparagine--tRNA ligase [Candidatus Eisenbacteria bacterium RBG_16_71_46]OGF21558.1 MAG: asparagine--tRNA ligase [Candidatus Eisenbacteria bacterium RBG_19FT_COMBO_70_11]